MGHSSSHPSTSLCQYSTQSPFPVSHRSQCQPLPVDRLQITRRLAYMAYRHAEYKFQFGTRRALHIHAARMGVGVADRRHAHSSAPGTQSTCMHATCELQVLPQAKSLDDDLWQYTASQQSRPCVIRSQANTSGSTFFKAQPYTPNFHQPNLEISR